MYPFSILTDEHVPVKFLMIKRLSKIKKSIELLIELPDFYNYKGRLRFYDSKLKYLTISTL